MNIHFFYLLFHLYGYCLVHIPTPFPPFCSVFPFPLSFTFFPPNSYSEIDHFEPRFEPKKRKNLNFIPEISNTLLLQTEVTAIFLYLSSRIANCNSILMWAVFRKTVVLYPVYTISQRYYGQAFVVYDQGGKIWRRRVEIKKQETRKCVRKWRTCRYPSESHRCPRTGATSQFHSSLFHWPLATDIHDYCYLIIPFLMRLTATLTNYLSAIRHPKNIIFGNENWPRNVTIWRIGTRRRDQWNFAAEFILQTAFKPYRILFFRIPRLR